MRSWRINFILVIFFVLGAAIISRLFFLQIISHKLYQAQALGQQAGFSETQGKRGEVFFENSQESKGAQGSGKTTGLAINKEKWIVSAMPGEIENKENFSQILSQAVGEEKEFVFSKIDSPDSYVIIKKDLPVETIEKIKKINLKGLYWENSQARYYPQGNMASSTIGFFGGDGAGQYGIEGYYDEVLKGKSGIKEQKRGLDLIGFQSSDAGLDGSDIYLTIDYNIQFEAESLLQEAKESLDIASGQIIVMKPDSGRILALANYPSFDPNQYSKERDLDIFQNASVQKLFEPGSVMKPFTMAAALNEGKITPNTTFTDTGSVRIGIQTIYNFDRQKYGVQTMTGVLEKSINTGAVFASQQISHEILLDYFGKFGFWEKTGVDLQGESYSRNDVLKNGPDVGFATASFGQGIEMTPIQLARAFSVIANGGKLVEPYIAEKFAQNGTETKTSPKISEEQVISKATASELTIMLINVVERGFGDGAKIPGYYLAGKTGTAEVPFENKKGYYPDKTIQSFIGFGPALNPQFLILVKLDDPKVPKSSLSAVPVFKKLAQYIINYWQIPPDYNIDKN